MRKSVKLGMESLENRILLSVSPVAPTINPDFYSLKEDSALVQGVSVGVLSNDTGLSAVKLLSGPDHGKLIFNSKGAFAYAPDAGFSGQDAFVYSAPYDDSLQGIVTLTVTPNTSGVKANPDNYVINQHSKLTISGQDGVLDNDVGTGLYSSLSKNAQNGKITLNSDGSFTYDPKNNFYGEDSFQYRAFNADGASISTVTVRVNSPVVAENDHVETREGEATTLDPLANDTNLDADLLTFELISSPANGVVVKNDDGTVTYTPNAGFIDQDHFDYEVSDGMTVSTGRIFVKVNEFVSTPDLTATTLENQNVEIIGVGDSDLNATIIIDTEPTNGTVDAFWRGGEVIFNYTPDTHFVGTDTFTYLMEDSGETFGPGTVTITVENEVITAVDDEFTMNEGEILTLMFSDLTDNDLGDTDDDASVTIFGEPNNATLDWTVITIDGQEYTALVITPDPGYSGIITFTYASDDEQDMSNEATVTIEVANLPPIANNDSYTTYTTEGLVIGDPGVLLNDVGYNMTTTLVTDPTGGTLIFGTDGSFAYQPRLDFAGTDSFVYQTNEPDGSNSQATVTITVLENITAINDTYMAEKGVSLIADVSVWANDIDPNNNITMAGVYTPPLNGTLIFDTNTGTFAYETTDPNFIGTDSFTYWIFDADGHISNPATVTITVQGLTGNADSYSTPTDTLLTVNTPGVLGNDVLAAYASILMFPQNGNLFFSDNGSFIYTPATGFNGVDSFTYAPVNANNNIGVETLVTINVGKFMPFNDLFLSFDPPFFGGELQVDPGIDMIGPKLGSNDIYSNLNQGEVSSLDAWFATFGEDGFTMGSNRASSKIGPNEALQLRTWLMDAI